MNHGFVHRVSGWVLGHDRRQRLRLGRTLTAAAVFVFSLVMQWWSVKIGLAQSEGAAWLTGMVLCGVALSYIALRSGWSLRFADPGLTMPQMLFAIVSLAFAYVVNAPVRGMLLMVVALVLMFGAFILPPDRCRRLGLMAVLILGAVMAAGVTLSPQRFDPSIEGMHAAFAAVVLYTVSVLAGQLSQLRIVQRRQKGELREALANLKVVATRDELTGLPNRRHFLEWFDREAARCRRSSSVICLAILDLDHFKRINDTLGHAVGDAVLARFARCAGECFREHDMIARWGGEEFLLAMPDASIEEMAMALNRLRALTARPGFWDAVGAPAVTFSAGVTDHRLPEPMNFAIERADRALYEAKMSGRDRFVVCTSHAVALVPTEPAALSE